MEHKNTKKRSQSCYNNKVNKIKKWYAWLKWERAQEKINPNTKLSVKRQELKPLDFYIEKIRKVTN